MGIITITNINLLLNVWIFKELWTGKKRELYLKAIDSLNCSGFNKTSGGKSGQEETGIPLSKRKEYVSLAVLLSKNFIE